jgi:outer membrane protein OmpA-like peptidoglycan-associated protein
VRFASFSQPLKSQTGVFNTTSLISASRIKVVSFGEEKPAAEGHDESSWALNRRVELKFPQ